MVVRLEVELARGSPQRANLMLSLSSTPTGRRDASCWGSRFAGRARLRVSSSFAAGVFARPPLRGPLPRGRSTLLGAGSFSLRIVARPHSARGGSFDLELISSLRRFRARRAVEVDRDVAVAAVLGDEFGVSQMYLRSSMVENDGRQWECATRSIEAESVTRFRHCTLSSRTLTSLRLRSSARRYSARPALATGRRWP